MFRGNGTMRSKAAEAQRLPTKMPARLRGPGGAVFTRAAIFLSVLNAEVMIPVAAHDSISKSPAHFSPWGLSTPDKNYHMPKKTTSK